MDTTKLLRAALIALLDSDDGVTEDAYVKLQSLEAAIAPNSCHDIFEATDAQNGFFFLSSDHGLK